MHRLFKSTGSSSYTIGSTRRFRCVASASNGAGFEGIKATSSGAAIKEELRAAIKGTDRGIFGCQAAKRKEIADVVTRLEAETPLKNPTEHLDLVVGDWKVLYTTVEILGSKRTRLGLREFVKLGDFLQRIDLADKTAVNQIKFSVAGFGKFAGELSIEASYEVAGPSRVTVTFVKSTLVPDALQKLFEQNYDLLLSIFNPSGWLDITYVDDELRIGRDDKGNVFILERAPAAPPAAAALAASSTSDVDVASFN